MVVALTDFSFTVKRTGRQVVERDEPHVWRFNEAGRVVSFRHCADTHQHVPGLRE
ncbi:MAG: hypothetical protein ONB48_07425 [candidate division KSB1 bacterium]|nr:hypothetical protein [candidate division KSB1 bacterium]MDZ7274651.1 hypothetical protein [candidate division KSB1 bacterium]MDZ7285476.1 hypothetical protein [candidate division KSB1 bacterium]MDZ7298508.1 hypothetical protein [candidate division KSB1 bacterium]MDZ7306268.1 hypothetical protein [candidate division KSB1 bacterium]